MLIKTPNQIADQFQLTSQLPPYIFAAISDLKQQAAANGISLIDFGMGNPDSAPPANVMQKLSKLSLKPELYGYSKVGGIDSLKKALAAYYQSRFGVALDYQTQCLVTIGAKEGITSLATAISSNQDYIVVANPSYPIHTFAFIIAKSNAVPLAANSPTDFLQKFQALVANSSRKPAAVIVNYPSNPTSQTVDLAFYQQLVDFCLLHKIYIISDIAYAEIYFDENKKPPSILQIKNSSQIAVEFSSVSKSFSMAGCRVGFAAGNQILIAALTKIKSYLDYGSFEPLQLVAIEALSVDNHQYLKDLRQKYLTRAKFFIEILKQELNWQVQMPEAGMFLWAKIPDSFFNRSQSNTSFDFCKFLIEQTGVVLSPGSSFGSNGEGYVRISLIHDQVKISEAVLRIKNWLNAK